MHLLETGSLRFRFCLRISLLAFLAIDYQPAMGQEEALAQSNKQAPSAAEIKNLIEELGAETFETRELATARLFEIGPAALGMLKLVDPNTGLEKYQRAQDLIRQIEDERFKALSRSFLLSRTPEKFDSLPGWSKFSTIAGTSRTSRLLYLDALEANPALLQFIEQTNDTLNDGEKAALTKQILAACELTDSKRKRLIEPSIGDLSAILFAACLLEQPLPMDGSIFLIRSIGFSPFTTYLRKRGYEKSLKKMLNLWIVQVQPIFDYQLLSTGLRWNLEESAQIARRNLATKDVPDPNTQRFAIHCICRFGDKSDIPLLITLFQDSRIVDRYREAEIPSALRTTDESQPPPAQLSEDARFLAMRARWVVRVKDMAFAAALILDDEDPLDVLPNFEWDLNYGFRKQAMAIPELPTSEADRLAIEARDKAIETWLAKYQGSDAN